MICAAVTTEAFDETVQSANKISHGKAKFSWLYKQTPVFIWEAPI